QLRLDSKGPELFQAREVSPEKDPQVISLCPGSKHFTKMWPAEYFIELGNELINMGFGVKLVGGKDDRTICAEISKGVLGSIDVSNDNDFEQICVELKKSPLVICNDSGLMHTATALDVPVISIFGSTVEEFGFFPYKSRNLVLENKGLSCRPCSHIGRNRCPKKHFKCMREIKPQMVIEALTKMM
ncbi:MAG: glycosyltransferase family 9 protein, partial [Melioribacteraceae bacterium]|nr:glycosyltransferase family 9 protein [Melioribacteraceae bacterium]